MNEELELAKLSLKNANDYADIKSNPVVELVLMPVVKVVRILAANDKVKYFGNLIRNGYLSREYIENNEFEEYLEILNTVSYCEMQYLLFKKEKPIGKKRIIS